MLELYHIKMLSASNEFQDKRRIKGLVFCQSQSSKSCWVPASLQLQLRPASMVKSWLYISITAVQVLLAHLLKVPIELTDTWNQELLGLICSQGGLQQVGALHGAKRHPQCWAGPALLSFVCQKPGATMGFAAGEEQESSSPQKAFSAIPHLFILAKQAIGVKWGMGL